MITLSFPPSLHKAYITRKDYKRIRTDEAKNYIEEVRWEVIRAGVSKPFPRVSILRLTFYWPDDRPRDYDNHAYLVLNGLKTSLIEDDSWKNIGEKRLISGGIDRTNPRVEVSWTV